MKRTVLAIDGEGFSSAVKAALEKDGITVGCSCRSGAEAVRAVKAMGGGVSFIHYLTDLRVEKSKQLLANTDLTIAAIASQVGYDDATYFHRVFRRVAGLTPAAYRQRLQV